MKSPRLDTRHSMEMAMRIEGSKGSRFLLSKTRELFTTTCSVWCGAYARHQVRCELRHWCELVLKFISFPDKYKRLAVFAFLGLRRTGFRFPPWTACSLGKSNGLGLPWASCCRLKLTADILLSISGDIRLNWHSRRLLKVYILTLISMD